METTKSPSEPMALLSRIADRLILRPSTHPVDPQESERLMIPASGGDIEAWVTRIEPELASGDPLLVLKFPGAGGRAERGRVHPVEAWPDVAADVWTINHRGYGGSCGPASLQNFASTCEAIWKQAQRLHPERPIVVYGNSLGCLSALFLTARFPVAGAYLRNPPALAQMIASRTRYTWWSFGFSKWIAAQIPQELDAEANAAKSDCPALFIQSEQDRVIPTEFQQLVIGNYAGEVHKFVMRGVDHHHAPPEDQKDDYVEATRWLGRQVTK